MHANWFSEHIQEFSKLLQNHCNINKPAYFMKMCYKWS
jgi:hypothetical protein